MRRQSGLVLSQFLESHCEEEQVGHEPEGPASRKLDSGIHQGSWRGPEVGVGGHGEADDLDCTRGGEETS